MPGLWEVTEPRLAFLPEFREARDTSGGMKAAQNKTHADNAAQSKRVPLREFCADKTHI